MDKSKKKQRYSLRKTQLGVGSVLLATVLLTAGTTRADSVVGPGGGLGLTDGIQGKDGPQIMSLTPDGGGRRNPGDDRKPQVDDEAPRTPRLLDGGTQDGLGDGGKTKVESLAGPDGSGHGGNHLGLTLGLGGGAYIYGNGEHSEVEEPGVHVPEKGNEPKEKLPETPKPQPRVQDQPQSTPKSKPEETPKSAPLKAKPQSSPSGHSNSGLLSNAQDSTYKLYSQLDGQNAEEVKGGPIKNEEQLKEAEKKEKEAKKTAGYPYVDRFDRDGGKRVLLIFYKYKSYIITKSGEGETATQGTSTFYKDNTELEKEIEKLKKGFADTYDVKREDGEKDEDGVKVKTVTLTLTKKGLKPEVTPQPDKPSVPSTPEVAPQPDKPSVPSTPEVAPQPEKPSVPSKPEVAPKPDAKPSVPSIPEPEKLEMDKSMKVVPGKPKKATPEAQVPEAQVPQVPQVPQVQVPQSQAPQLPSPKEEVAKVQQQPRAIQSSAPAKSGGKQLPNTGEAASILTLVGSGMLGLLGLAFTKKRKTK
ncbi:LPXTG cell wall anchor domain-containing protein [Streptococcus ruminantium]|uniref:LPXTG cell wall anchor domain-containing protein n=1 Tax=Streptococcus ruminantium TaxID=1917441 RepID=UPI0012DC25C3|nr:YSIRK-type signal peptide-containing protein [Streptococcus ruminantium]